MKLERANIRFAGVVAAGAAAVLLTGMLARLPAAEPDATARVGGTAEECTVREVARRRLTVEDGRELYVEPVATVASGSRVLLAGTPNYLRGQMADGSLRRVTRDSVFGVVIDADLRAHTIPSPIPAQLVSGVRASAREDGTWDVVFAQEDPWSRFPPPDTARVVWYGRYDGREWSSLTRLPVPPGAVFHPALASPLVRRGDTLAWAMNMTGSDRRMRVGVFERRDGNWSYGVAPTGGPGYAALLHSDTAGLLLAVVQPDPAVPGDTESLLLYRRQPEWHLLGPVVRGSVEPVGNPIYDPAPGGRAFGWMNTFPSPTGHVQSARAIVGAVGDPRARVIELDQDVVELAVVPMPDGGHVWVSGSTSQDSPRLRFLREGVDSARSIGSLPYPYMGGFGAVATGVEEILVNGPEVDPVTRSSPTTLLLKVRMECGPPSS